MSARDAQEVPRAPLIPVLRVSLSPAYTEAVAWVQVRCSPSPTKSATSLSA